MTTLAKLKVIQAGEQDKEEKGEHQAGEQDKEERGEQARPEPEVLATARRRTFSAKYKKRILEEIDQRLQSGLEIGSVLRREGLFSSHISKWRKVRDGGSLHALEPKKRGRKPAPDADLYRQLKQAQADNARLSKELEQAEFIIDVQKKLSQLLGLNGER
jgi:transposase-like protein